MFLHFRKCVILYAHTFVQHFLQIKMASLVLYFFPRANVKHHSGDRKKIKNVFSFLDLALKMTGKTNGFESFCNSGRPKISIYLSMSPNVFGMAFGFENQVHFAILQKRVEY